MTDTQQSDAVDRIRTLLDIGDLKAGRNELGEQNITDLHEVLRRLADYENRITWHTTCQQCANDLDRAYTEHVRADVAEAQRDEARAQLAGLHEEWAFQYVSYGVTETSLVCESREEAEQEAGRHRRGDRIVRRLCGDWEAVEADAASENETGPGND